MSKRDPKRLSAIRQLPCCQCGHPAPSQACHSNFSEHGKGRGIKADDRYTIPLCYSCHYEFDTYQGRAREQAKKWFLDRLKFIDEVLDGSNNKAVF